MSSSSDDLKSCFSDNGLSDKFLKELESYLKINPNSRENIKNQFNSIFSNQTEEVIDNISDSVQKKEKQKEEQIKIEKEAESKKNDTTATSILNNEKIDTQNKKENILKRSEQKEDKKEVVKASSEEIVKAPPSLSQYEYKKTQILQTSPTTICPYKEGFYLFGHNKLRMTLQFYNLLNDEIKDLKDLTTFSCGFDMDQEGMIYTVHNRHLIIGTQSYFIGTDPLCYSMGIKKDLDSDYIYFTLATRHQIYYSDLEGKKVKRWGRFGQENGEFNTPLGIAVDDKNVYACDSENNRVQILNKTNGKYKEQWGEYGNIQSIHFTEPSCIYYDSTDNIIYVGDKVSIYLFTTIGECIQHLCDSNTEFNNGSSLCVIKKKLYVCDMNQNRIQIYERE